MPVQDAESTAFNACIRSVRERPVSDGFLTVAHSGSDCTRYPTAIHQPRLASQVERDMRGALPPLLLPASLAIVLVLASACQCSGAMTTLELSELRNSTVELFKHAFGSYMAHAFPMDELRPLSCQGTNSFGGVSVTLIDSLDTLAVMGLRQEFAEAVEVGAV